MLDAAIRLPKHRPTSLRPLQIDANVVSSGKRLKH